MNTSASFCSFQTDIRGRDSSAPFVFLAFVHGAVLFVFPSAVVIAIGMWWNSNTISHYFIHRPFFQQRSLNLLFSLFLTALLGIPQTLWRIRHLAHHANVAPRLKFSYFLLTEVLLVGVIWTWFFIHGPTFFLWTYIPGFFAGLGLCYLQGHFEHVRGPVSHYGFLYNFLFFNDGFHVEHHRNPSMDWTSLPHSFSRDVSASRWPAVLRWIEYFSLDSLERIVLRSKILQSWVLTSHEKAFRKMLGSAFDINTVAVIGGGLFPRTVLVLQRIFPQCKITVIDKDTNNLAIAKPFVSGNVDWICQWFKTSYETEFDLVVVPLAYRGDKAIFYETPPARKVLVHDWIWNKQRDGILISLFFLKAINLVECDARPILNVRAS